jgi:hypothetical protein
LDLLLSSVLIITTNGDSHMDTAAARLFLTRPRTDQLTGGAVRGGRRSRLAILIDEGNFEAKLSGVDVVLEQLATAAVP